MSKDLDALILEIERNDADVRNASEIFNRIAQGLVISKSAAVIFRDKLHRARRAQRNLLIGVLILNNVPQKDIAQRFGMSVSRISQIKKTLGITLHPRSIGDR